MKQMIWVGLLRASLLCGLITFQAGAAVIAKSEDGSASAKNKESATTASEDLKAVQNLTFVKRPASGRMFGKPFTIDGGVIGHTGTIVMGFGPGPIPLNQISISFPGRDLSALEGKQFIIKGGATTSSVPCIVKLTKMQSSFTPQESPEYFECTVETGLEMRISIGSKAGGKIPIYVIMRCPDKQQSYINGFFYARIAD